VHSNIVFETPRLQLSYLSEDDAEFIFDLLNEPAFLRDIGDKGVRNVGDARNYIADGPAASYAKNGFGLYRVALKATQEPIGMCGLLKRDVLDDPDLGYALLSRHWGRGYAIEAASATMKHATDLGLARVLAITALENPSSIRLLEKLGFRFQSVAMLAGYDVPSRLFAWEPTQA
jgi:[ribosomal protein S5]-alanine N-acetyltransferase